MVYTKAQRKIIHKQLVGAKKYLWDGTGRRDSKCEFICLAVIAHVRRTNSIRRWLTTTNMIEGRLGVCYTFGLPRDVKCWLDEVAKIPKEQFTDLAVQTYRHEWLDELIKEFSD